MQENLDKNNEVNKEISDNTTKSNSEEIKEPNQKKLSTWIQIMVILQLKLL